MPNGVLITGVYCIIKGNQATCIYISVKISVMMRNTGPLIHILYDLWRNRETLENTDKGYAHYDMSS